PARSMVRAPAGTATLLALPTAASFPSRMTIVWLALGPAPVPSMIVAFVSATTGSLTLTKSRVVFDIDATGCADTLPARTDNTITATVFRMCSPVVFVPLLDGEAHHHSRREMLGDVTV